MDFHGLSRKELQTLCKKNKIPANMTNVAMAHALAALTNVEGIEEIGRPETASEKLQPVPDSPHTCGRASTRRRAGKDQVVSMENEQESNRQVSRTRGRPRKIIQDDEQEAKDPKDLFDDSSVRVPESPRTSLRSSTRRRPVSRNADVSIENNLESSKPLTRTRCRTRRVNQEEEEQVDKDLGNLTENPSRAVNPKTPATRNSRRRTAASAVKVNEMNKKEDEEEEEEEKDEKTKQDPVVTRVYSTRRSARLQPKISDADLKTGRTKAVQIASLSEEENEEPTKKSAPVEDEIEHVSEDNKAKILASDLCVSDVCAQQEDLAPKDVSAIVIPVEDSSSNASSVPEHSTCEEKSIIKNLIADQHEEDSATEISGITDLAPDQMMMLENPHCLEMEESNLEASIVNEADLVSEQLTVEKTHNLQDNESKADDDSNACEDYLIEEDASVPVISAEALHKNVEPAIERSENVKFEYTDVEEPESQVIGKAELCEKASCEFSSSHDGEILGNEISEESLYKDLELLHCKSSDKQMVIPENTEQSSCLSKVLKLENEELNNGNIDAYEDVERTRDLEGSDVEELGLHADGSGEIPPSLSEIWDFGLMKDSIQECLNGLESEKYNSDSVPLDIEVLGKVESGQEEPSHLDFNSTEITGWFNCQSPEEAESIKEPLDEQMVAPENQGLVSKPDAAMELPFLPDDEMKTRKFGQIADVIGDADSIAIAKILCSDESRTEECNKGLSDEITISSAAVPSFYSPCRGIISESGYHLNQIKVTPSKSSTKKSGATPSQRKAPIMVLDENKENNGNYSAGMSLRKKSNSKALASAADEKENIGNYSGGLSLRNKSNSKIIALVAEETEDKQNYSGGLILRNKSNSKVTISVAEEKENNNKFEESVEQTLKNTSLRQLKKMFKNKLLTTDNNSDNKNNDAVKEQQQVEKTRAALQTLTDNNSFVGNREN